MNAQNFRWLFVTAAKGLQSYVLRSDPMKEMVGASELIEWLPRARGRNHGFMDQVLQTLGTEFKGQREILSDASGAVRILFENEEEAKMLARLWPILAAEYAPGLEIVVAVVEIENNDLAQAIRNAERELSENRNLPVALLPEAGPLVERNRRTGLPATQSVLALDAEDRETGRPDAVDDESGRKRIASSSTAHNTLLGKILPTSRLESLLPQDEHKREALWPLDVTKLATKDSSYIAVIHADANGLGTVMMNCLTRLNDRPEPAKTYRDLCKAIEKSSEAAAKEALEHLLVQHQVNTKNLEPIPFRPLVCAGEDFTCIVRAEFAMKFLENYLLALERDTKKEFATIGVEGATSLTGCAGVVFCNSHFPFSRAYALAESLCHYAKKRTARKVSGVAFLRGKSSLQPSDDCEEIMAHHFDADEGASKIRLTMGPYLVGDQSVADLPRLKDLFALVEAFKPSSDPRTSVPRSGVRELVAEAYKGKAAADRAYERLSLIMDERNPAAWGRLLLQLKKLVQTDSLWRKVELADGRGESKFVHWETPIYDALELLHLNSNLK